MTLGGLFGLECVAFKFVDWGALMDELNGAGHSDTGIAQKINLPVSTLRSWRENPGREPRFMAGLALINLHSFVFGADETQKRIHAMREAVTRSA